MSPPIRLAPVPGIAWGAYPQRPGAQPTSEWVTRLARSARRAHAAGQAVRALAPHSRSWRFALRVSACIGEHANRPRAELIRGLQALRAGFSRDGLHDRHLLPACALLGELARRELGRVPYPAQIMAVHVMLRNRLAEMATGEGKTLAAGMTAALGALAGIPIHVVTANDYLVRRDRTEMAPLFDALGLTSAEVVTGQTLPQRRSAWQADIVYTTGRELVFDYLRDRLSGADPSAARGWLAGTPVDDQRAPLLRGLCMAIIDEADSVLLDEACMPLELEAFEGCLGIARSLWAGRDFRIVRAYRQVTLTDAGRRRVAALATTPAVRRMHPRERDARVITALAALHCYRVGHDYLLEDGRVVLIDAPTGRKAEGRTWSRGLHQMIELKEGAAPSPLTRTVAQITYQQFFARYLRLCGMSGSLREARGELYDVYDLPVQTIPLHRPSRRRMHRTRVHTGQAAKWSDVVALARAARHRKRAVLIAVDSVASAASVSDALSRAGLDHRRLDAGEHAAEAEVVAEAGRAGAITVATNMAGRGTDIGLGADVVRAGGLLTVICHYNPERRTDRQMSGRAARQGQPGDVLRIVALDDLAGFAAGARLLRAGRLLERLPANGRALVLRAVFRFAQRITEARHRRQRYRVLDAGRRRERLLALAGNGE